MHEPFIERSIDNGRIILEPNIANLRRYFVGREDCYATQRRHGGYSLVKAPVTDRVLNAHLRGDITVGTYTINTGNKVRCITWDVDSNEFSDVYRLLGAMPPPTAVFSSGRKGWHVIQSFSELQPADLAFQYGCWVKQQAGLEGLECFPKQSSIFEGEYGNLTKLPWGKHQVTGVFGDFIAGVSIGTADNVELHLDACVEHVRQRFGGTKQGGWLDNLFNNRLEDFGGRNNALNKYVYWLRQRDFPEELVAVNVNWVNSFVFDEALDDDEVDLLLRPRGGVV